MSLKKFRRKFGWPSSTDDATSQWQRNVQQNQPQPDVLRVGSFNSSTSSSAPTDMAGPPTPETHSLAIQASLAHTQDVTIQKPPPTHRDSETPIQELWDLAYQTLQSQDEHLISDFEEAIRGNISAALGVTVGSHVTKRDWMNTILQRRMEQVNRDSWKLKFGSSEVLVRDVAKPILGIVSWANDFVSKAVSANPSASIAWGGVSLLLPLFLNPSEQAASLAKGLEYIASVIVQSYLWEDLYLRRSKSEAAGPSQILNTTYLHALETLYQHILKFQITSYCYYARSAAYRAGLDSVKWNEWEELVEKIKDQERVFFAVLTVSRDAKYDEECLAAEKRHKQVMACWQSIGSDISGLLLAVGVAKREKEHEKLFEWLCSVDTSAQYNAARERHSDGTCEWLIQKSEDFKSWRQTPKSFLWLNGKAGSGKSILSSSVIKYLEDQCENDPQTALAYFFFNFGNPEQQNVAVMLSSLIRQLCASRPIIPQPVKSLESLMAKGQRPSIDALEAALKATVRGFSAVFIVIDALDECPILDGERGKLLAALIRLLDTMPDTLHFFCTSRAEPDIRTAMRSIICPPSRVSIDLVAESNGLHNDIDLYIRLVLESDDFTSWPGQLKASARKLLIERSDGMFQYVVCQFESLRNLRSRNLISSALDNLPKGLDATYDRLLLSLDPEFQAQILGSLKWLAFSNKALQLDEFAEIFILHPERDVGFDEEERLFKASDVLQYLSSIVITYGKGVPSAKYVRLAHFTVKEYLISSRIVQGPAACFSFTETDAHLHIAHCCLYYNIHRNDENEYEAENFPLADYAMFNWGWHLELVSRDKWTSTTARLVVRALALRSDSLSRMMRDGWYVGVPCIVGTENSRLKSLLRRPHCYTARLGFLQLTDFLLSAVPSTKEYLTQEDLELTLLEAASAGNTDIVQLVLRKGADVDAQKDMLGGALQAAAHNGHVATVELLLNMGADINAYHLKMGSALEAAASQNQSTVLELLLSRGADVRQSGCPLTSVYTSPLPSDEIDFAQRAESSRLLLAHGAQINKQCTFHGTVLSEAAIMPETHGAPDIVDFLLELGADPNLSGGAYGYALQAACLNWVPGHAERRDPACVAIKALLNKGADVNARGGVYCNALQAACYAGQTAAVEILLDNGAKIDERGGYFETALQAACASGNQYIVSLLLERRASVAIQGGKYGNALQAACHSNGLFGRQNCVKITGQLLERGADVNAAGGKFGNALQAAASSACELDEAVERLLLSKGAEVNKQGGLYGTALQGACVGGRVGVVRLLLAHGSEVNVECGEYGTALQAACALEDTHSGYDFESIQPADCGLPHLLIEHGADVHIQGGVFGSAWHAAATQFGRPKPNNDTLLMLLNRGIDVNDHKGRLHGTALQAALELLNDPSKMMPRIRFLLENGANINVEAGKYGFPLQSACMSPESSEGLTYLLENCPDIDVNMTGGLYGTALQAAVYTGKTNGVKLLLEKGVDVNARGGKYRSALNAAVNEGHWDLVEILLTAGAKPDCHQLPQLDEEWLEVIEKEDGRGAVERHRNFWKKQKPIPNEDKAKETISSVGFK